MCCIFNAYMSVTPTGREPLEEELVPFLYTQHLVLVFTANTTSPFFSLLFTALGAPYLASLLKFKGSRRQVVIAQNFGHVVSWPLLAQEGCCQGEHGKNTAEKKNRRRLSSILTVHRSPPLSELVKTHTSWPLLRRFWFVRSMLVPRNLYY